MEDEIQIKGTLSKTSDVFFFTASIPLLNNLKAECRSVIEATNSPLFEALFRLPWVVEAAAEGRALIVKKRDSYTWENCAPEVAQIVRQLHQQKIPFFTEAFIKAVKEKRVEEDQKKEIPVKVNETNINSPLGQRIQKILKEDISKSLASHGGYVSMVNLEGGKVYLYFGGGCQGCSQASVTVKEGIEKILLREFPEIISVVDVTDHKIGTNPYYR